MCIFVFCDEKHQHIIDYTYLVFANGVQAENYGGVR